MRNIDISPLYRHAIGFDRLFNLVENSQKKPSQNAYPPYNIEQIDEHNYRITMAVAGFSEDSISLTQNENMLVVSGDIACSETKPNYVYQGIAERNFERKFQLADYVNVSSASMENGLLHIELVRLVPEAMKARKILINK
ncbi:heat-shock protein Hsp20 [Alginatibacterium sediminis]|uniref:Heat-shock protein Hsp20 n=1 Tax=Alginatibacterium sediminis TaxID=2164068 RepID=A0A420EH18_9ALTE|nr:Hsp20 family protein [Alginatibacterium sediminis]RKF19960.1 heat-shock protein Hsp20 [Alginatibacterium sediminis]